MEHGPTNHRPPPVGHRPHVRSGQMLFSSDAWPGIRDGSITLTFRAWKRPQARNGGRSRTPVGVLAIDDVRRVPVERITREEARMAGYTSLSGLRAPGAGSRGLPDRVPPRRTRPTHRAAALRPHGRRRCSGGGPTVDAVRSSEPSRPVDTDHARADRRPSRDARGGSRRDAQTRHVVLQSRRPQAKSSASQRASRPDIAPRSVARPTCMQPLSRDIPEPSALNPRPPGSAPPWREPPQIVLVDYELAPSACSSA